MSQDGLFEELLGLQSTYPKDQRTHPLNPKDYGSAVLNQISREIGERLSDLAKAGDHQRLIELAETIRGQLNAATIRWHSPLTSIQYRNDGHAVPTYPQLFLSTPALITNHGDRSQNFIKTLKFELNTADRADLMVSFIRWSGVQLLIPAFEETIKHGHSIRILTSTYQTITEPKALRFLLGMRGVEVRLYDSAHESFHTKAYLFARDSGLNTVVIGSSNLSAAALQSGYEWNVKLPDVASFPIYQRAFELFNQMWADPEAVPMTSAIVDEYETFYRGTKSATKGTARFPLSKYVQQAAVGHQAASIHSGSIKAGSIGMIVSKSPVDPNPMQQRALAALKQTRVNGHRKGVVIAATGTGKTYLSALDVKGFGAPTILFIAHREELLDKAKATFGQVFGSDAGCGKLTGTDKDWTKPFLFSTIQTLHRDEHLTRFPPDHFEYIVVDEFHHADARTYRKVLDYFQPRFLLGLTATPERMDGGNILDLCDNNVVHEIRLREALKEKLLAPFHFFGLHDSTVDYDQVSQQSGLLDEQELSTVLKTPERVDYIVKMMEKFGHDGEQMIALGFCATVDHAQYMADEFNRRGLSAECLSGSDPSHVRQAAIERLEGADHPLQVIFTVNIFNEGIDIPSVNLLLFLRPTESVTVFIQQLGRGLRRTDAKQYVTVLDFIGNYRKSFVVPLALAGQVNHLSFDRDSLRVAVETEFGDLPAGCYVDLAEVARQQILERIEGVRMDAGQMLRDLYMQFKRHLGRDPELEDFLYSEEAPGLVFFIKKYKSWVQTKQRMIDKALMQEFDNRLLGSPLHVGLTQRLEQMLPIKWPYEFVILDLAMRLTSGAVTVAAVVAELERRFQICTDLASHGAIVERAMKRLSEAPSARALVFGLCVNGGFTLSQHIRDGWNEPWVRGYLQQRLEYGLTDFRRSYRPEMFFQHQHGVLLYQNYTRGELKFLFQDPTAKLWQAGSERIGKDYLLFVTLKKGDEVATHLKFRDYFIDQNTFHWQSQNQTAHHSTVGKDYVHHLARGLKVHLFVRKFAEMHNVVLPFMYVGEVTYVSSHDDSPMTVIWRLKQPVPDDHFTDFIR